MITGKICLKGRGGILLRNKALDTKVGNQRKFHFAKQILLTDAYPLSYLK
jgi:hypothetical protein